MMRRGQFGNMLLDVLFWLLIIGIVAWLLIKFFGGGLTIPGEELLKP